MDIVKMINQFTGDIYFKKSHEIMEDYYNIIRKFDEFVNAFSQNKELLESKNEVLRYLSRIQETGDFTRMADALNEVLIPIMVDLLNVSESKMKN